MRGVCSIRAPSPSVSQSFSFCIGSSSSKHTFSRLHTLSAVGSSSPDHHHYQMKANKYWNIFYKRHHNKFFKDRHYLEKDWAHYFSSANPNSPNLPTKLVLEVGCGAGNTVFPLITAFPNVVVHACDFSSNAIALIKSHEDFREERVKAFVCDVTNDDLCQTILPSSIDVVTLPNGYVLFRDYATGDFAQEKLMQRNQMISENFYVRGDGTCAFYFSEDFLSTLFKQDGFDPVEINVYCKQIENRSRNIIMDRRWIRAVFCSTDHVKPQTTPITESI